MAPLKVEIINVIIKIAKAFLPSGGRQQYICKKRLFLLLDFMLG